jgi:hypothetical protein
VIDLSKLTTAIKHQNHSNGNIHLTGLAAVTCILKLLSKRHSKEEIIHEKFNGDVKLVSTWIDFLKENHWVVEEKNEDDYKVTNLRITKKVKYG